MNIREANSIKNLTLSASLSPLVSAFYNKTVQGKLSTVHNHNRVGPMVEIRDAEANDPLTKMESYLLMINVIPSLPINAIIIVNELPQTAPS